MLNGTLFTSDFLIDGIKDSEYWKSIPDNEVALFGDAARRLYDKFPTSAAPNESQTERDLIDPLLAALGWQDFLTQQTATHKGRFK